MKRSVLVQIAFLIAGMYTISNCSDQGWNPFSRLGQTQWVQRFKNSPYNPYRNPRPTSYVGYADWLESNDPGLRKFNRNNPEEMAHRSEYSKQDFEGVSPWEIKNLRSIQGRLQEEVRRLRAEIENTGILASTQRPRADQAEIQKQEVILQQKRDLAERHLEQFGQFLRHQENYLAARQQYKFRKLLPNRPSFGACGINRYGHKLQYPEMPYSPYGD